MLQRIAREKADKIVFTMLIMLCRSAKHYYRAESCFRKHAHVSTMSSMRLLIVGSDDESGEKIVLLPQSIAGVKNRRPIADNTA